jgi:site-specific DNA recombinase
MEVRKVKRAAIYTRVSTTMQVEDGSSIDNQIDKLEAFCKYNGYDLDYRFSDPGVSGRKFENRPQFMQMIKLVEKKQIDVVVVYSLSRFGRNLKDTLKWIEYLEKNGVSFYTQDFQADTSTSHGKLMMQMIAAFAEFESNQRSELITSVMHHLKDQEKVYCGPTPLGFKKINDQLIIIPEEMEIVSTVFDMKSTGVSYFNIASTLNNKGLIGKKGGKFTQSTIKKIVDNSIYTKHLNL